MITFRDMVEKITVEHGVAAERLNRELAKLVLDQYCAGMEAGAIASEAVVTPDVFEHMEKVKTAKGPVPL